MGVARCAKFSGGQTDGGIASAGKKIGLKNITLLDPLADTLCKLVCYVPQTHAEQVRMALGEAGAGKIGDYQECAFEGVGKGYFRPNEAANPFIGRTGKLEQVNEVRLEVEVFRWDIGRIVQTLKAVHPYEEVAYNIYPLQNTTPQFGMGAVGELVDEMPLALFLQQVATCLAAPAIRFAGDKDKMVKRVAVCGGSGSSLIGSAEKMGADAFVTADVSYHFFFNTYNHLGQPNMAILDVGHYESEVITEQLLQQWLAERFSDIDFIRTTTKTNPMHTFIPA